MSTTEKSNHQDNASQMRVAEIRHELQELKIDFRDCFDKESLVARLQDARAGKVQPTTTTMTESSSDNKAPTTESSSDSKTPTTTTTIDEPSQKVHKASVKEEKQQKDETASLLQEVRGMTVRALREELASRQIRWAGLLEKEDLVQAVVRARQEAAHFSVTGCLTAGQVGEVTGEQLERELREKDTPLLLDVYATWCGPCQLVKAQLEQVAASFGDRVRVAKMDSDKEHEASAKLRVEGLPTLVLFRNGQEVDRIEGALMKDQIVQWVNSKL